MVKILIIGSGGFVGAVLRYLVSGLAQQLTGSIAFPFGTLAVNVIGCGAIGMVSHAVETWGFFSAQTRMFILIGCLGAFTTYSTFGNETLNLIRESKLVLALANVGAHLVLGLGAVWLGRTLSLMIWR